MEQWAGRTLCCCMIIGGNVWRSQTLKPLIDSFERADPSEYSFAFPAKSGDFPTLLSDFFFWKATIDKYSDFFCCYWRVFWCIGDSDMKARITLSSTSSWCCREPLPRPKALTGSLTHILPLSPLSPNRSRQMFSYFESGSIWGFFLLKGSFFLPLLFVWECWVSLKLKPEEFGLEPALCVKCLEMTLLWFGL